MEKKGDATNEMSRSECEKRGAQTRGGGAGGEERNHRPYVIRLSLFPFIPSLPLLTFKLPSPAISLPAVALPVSPSALSPEQD